MAELRFDGQVAVVTGAGRGMGREHALLLARRGARVVVNNRSAPAAEQVVAEICAAGGDAVAAVADVCHRSGAQAVVSAAIETYGRVDAIVNNAGISLLRRFQDTTDGELDDLIDTHVRGSWWVTQCAWPHLIEQGYGRVVFITSAAGFFGVQNQTAYATAKSALIGLSRSLAAEGSANGIKVNALQTSADTDMTRQAMNDPAYQDWKKRTQPAWATSVPVALLAHEQCPANGEIFCVGGTRLSQFFIAETPGYVNTSEFTPETLLAHVGDVRERSRYAVHADGGDWMLFGGEQLGMPFTGNWGQTMSPKD
jgi:NAD(P)-dependent dehydrogenase (short-subunit alcohol dehydrogenase family)